MNTHHARTAAQDLTHEDRADEITSVRLSLRGRAPQHDAHEISSIRPLPSDQTLQDDDDAITGVQPQPALALDLETDVEIEAGAADLEHDEPTPVYARPYNRIGGQRYDFTGRTYLGTRF